MCRARFTDEADRRKYRDERAHSTAEGPCFTVTFRPQVYLSLQALQVRNALRHQCRILLQFDEVVLDVSLPCRGEDLLPVDDALTEWHLFRFAVGGHPPALTVHGDIAARIAGEVIHRIEPVLHGGDLKLQ